MKLGVDNKSAIMTRFPEIVFCGQYVFGYVLNEDTSPEKVDELSNIEKLTVSGHMKISSGKYKKVTGQVKLLRNT